MSGSLSASTVAWLNLIPLTAQEGLGKTASECKDGLHNEEGGRIG